MEWGQVENIRPQVSKEAAHSVNATAGACVQREDDHDAVSEPFHLQVFRHEGYKKEREKTNVHYSLLIEA